MIAECKQFLFGAYMRITEPYTIFPRKLPSGKTVYYYQYRDDYGIRSSARSTGCDTLAKAKRFCQKLYNDNQFSATRSTVLFSTFSKELFTENSRYFEWKKINGKQLKPETIRRYVVSLEYQLLPFFDDMDIRKISKETIKEWVIWASEKWSPKTINNAQGVLNIILESAIDRNIIQNNPLHKIGYRKTEKKKRQLLTIEEIKELYNSEWSNPYEKSAFLLAVITGMRSGEIMALHQKDIYENYLDVKYSISERYGLGTTKTDLCRYVPLPKGFKFVSNDTLFAFPIKAHSVYNAMTRKLVKMGIDIKARGITVHSLRNFFISYLQSENIPEPKIRAVVGHADKTMTDLYTYWTPQMFPEVYEAQNKLFKQITGGN